MAGDWIPIELNLSRKSEVIRLARLTKRSKAEVIGLLVQFWAWVSEQTSDGTLQSMTAVDLSVAVDEADGQFWAALSEVGWLNTDDDGLFIPNADRWLAQGAKGRLANTRRQRTYRSRNGSSATKARQKRDKSATKTPPEKRREEKRSKESVSKRETLCRPEVDRADEIRAIFDRYRTFHPAAHKTPSPKMAEWKKINARLDEGYSVDELKLAIDGCHRSAWHQGQNDRQKKYDRLELIVRDGSHVVEFMELAKGETHGDKYSNPKRTDEKGRATL